MGANSKIEWTDHTFNPWRGCTKVAAGCANCYAERDAKRFPDKLGIWGDDGTRVVAAESTWKQPKTWNDAAAKASVRARVFCASLADWAEDWQGPIMLSGKDPVYCGKDFRASHGTTNPRATLDDVRRRLFALIDATPHLDWLLLTKRPENIQRFWKPWKISQELYEATAPAISDDLKRQWNYRSNVWLGTSIATQEDADRNIPELLKCRNLAPVLFVSAEPLLGPVDLRKVPNPDAYFKQTGRTGVVSEPNEPDDYVYWTSKAIDWLICGGESGHGARPMHPDWARSLRDQCTAAGVPFFFKQWGEWGPVGNDKKIGALLDNGRLCFPYTRENALALDREIGFTWDRHSPVSTYREGKAKTGRELDGRTWDELPAAAGVRV